MVVSWAYTHINLWTKTCFPIWFRNTLITALATAVLQTLIVLSVSYVLSRLRFKGRKLLMNTCLVLGMFPGFVTMIVLYKVLSGMGLTGANSVPGLILVYCASSGMGYYVSKGFFDTIPKSLDEAARVDGASRFQVFYKVIMPLSKPIVIYTVLTAFMAPWGDFMFAKYISHNTEVGMNVAVGLQYWISSKALIATNYTMFCTGGVVVAHHPVPAGPPCDSLYQGAAEPRIREDWGARLRTVPSRDASPMPMTSRMERQGMSVSARSTVKGMSVLML